MRQIKNLRKRVYYLASFVVTVAMFILVFHSTLDTFASAGEAKQTDLDLAIKPGRNFVDFITVYSDHYFTLHNGDHLSDLFGLIRYDDEYGGYLLNRKGDSELTGVGTLTGLGEIPQDSVHITELSMAMELSSFFSKYYEENLEIAWLYYTSANDFIYIYPQAERDFLYTERLKTVPFYTYATPESNPGRAAVWTPVYLDEAGKGLMVTVSSPIYKNDEFMGVISLDLTTETLHKLLRSDYVGYLIDRDDSVIAAGQSLDLSDGVEKLNNILKLPETAYEKVRRMNSGSVQRIGTNYYYKYDFSAAPWSIVLVLPLLLILLKSLLYTLPVSAICFLFLLTFREAENRRNAEEKLRVTATTDALTGLKNRYYLDGVIDAEFVRSDRENRPLSVIMLDLDRFKGINDAYGHAVGDEVLIQTAEVTQSMIRKSDTVIRLGGEEFLILLPFTDSAGSVEAAEKIRKALEEKPHPVAGICTASFGVAERIKGETYSNLYRRADEALYQAKQRGRNCVVAYESNDVVCEPLTLLPHQ